MPKQATVGGEANVIEWRMLVLTEAGYPENDALSIAYSAADLHRACDLLANGCAVATAVEIIL